MQSTITDEMIAQNARAMVEFDPEATTSRALDQERPDGLWSADVSPMLVDAYRASQGATSLGTPFGSTLDRSGDGVRVDAIAADRDGSNLLEQLQAIGLRDGAVAGAAVSGVLPVEALPAAVAVPSLQSLSPTAAVTWVGAAEAQSDEALFADVVRDVAGVDGSGVTIGILSDSYNNSTTATTNERQDIATGDLPGPGNPNGFTTPVRLLDDSVSGIDEGRGMAQLIHDIAPGAELVFHTAFGGQADFADGIRELAAAGADIIVDDVANLGSPFFQDGVIAQAVDDVAADDVLYYSSAGNGADRAYTTTYRAAVDDEGFYTDEFLDFDPGPGVDTRLLFSIPSGGDLFISVQWDDPFASAGGAGAESDLGLALLDPTLPNGQNVIGIVDNPNLGADAAEFLRLSADELLPGAAERPTTVELAVFLSDGEAPDQVKLIQFGDADQAEFAQSTPTVFGQSVAEGARSIGASSFFSTPAFGQSPPLINDFSAFGPATILFDTEGNRLDAPEVRLAPDLVGVDGVDTTFFGRNTADDDRPSFFGTSAAAPAVAAVAALLQEAVPAASAAEINEALEATAIDMGVAGVDDRTGFGLVQAEAALAFLEGDGLGDVVVSASPDRSAPRELTGANFATGDVIHAFVDDAAPDLARVEFRLDGELVQRESNAPWDVAGSSGRQANGLDTADLAAGDYELETRLFLDADDADPAVTLRDTFTLLDYDVVASPTPDRSRPFDLDGSVFAVGEPLYALVDNSDERIQDVTFTLDGEAINTEFNPPFDVNGGSDTLAAGLETSDFDAGERTLETRITFDDGGGFETVSLTDTFTLVPFDVVASAGADRSAPIDLDGATVTRGDPLFAFVANDDGRIEQVEFRLDGETIQTEGSAPWEIGGDTNGTADGLDTRALEAGARTLETIVTFDDGLGFETVTLTDDFTLVA